MKKVGLGLYWPRLRKELLTELTIIDGYMAGWRVVVGFFLRSNTKYAYYTSLNVVYFKH